MSSELYGGQDPGALGPEDEADGLTPEVEDDELEDPDLVVDPDDPEDEHLPRDRTAIYE